MIAPRNEAQELFDSLGDESAWGEPVHGTARSLDAIILVKFSLDELEEIRDADPAETTTQFIRTAALTEARAITASRKAEASGDSAPTADLSFDFGW